VGRDKEERGRYNRILGDLVNTIRRGDRCVCVKDSLEGREIEPAGSLRCQVGDSVSPVCRLYCYLDSYNPAMPAFPQPEGLAGNAR